ncbi:tannase-domain-containing protein [Bimuria novae-zelandiae CBS 107.79]|uniref:Carboxylic ester hydrolase n=1 Tax=Bimuria novae-zelandiae CBS 107.79 TaxID=1447943 RepID=A0A6A5VIB8_9PLEO|nr:tannase-domain-containing protein [Bimuria novae-zelandiae CBS 107.79]
MLSKITFVWLAATWAVKSNDEIELVAPICDSATFRPPNLGARVVVKSIEAEVQRNYTSQGGVHGLPDIDGLNFCQLKAHLNHEGTDDDVLVEVWLPLGRDSWNGRFQATGGSGMATGVLGQHLGQAVKQGYAASSTDGGHPPINTDASWVLKPDGTIDWNLLTNFATRSLVESIILGKSLTEQFYQEKPKYSYWNGCSQGGRQGYMLAQEHPDLLDGILANAPALSLTRLVMAEFWPQLVMKEEGLWVSSCEFNYFRQKAMESCDMMDGVSDGIISEFELCDFDPLHVIGQVFYCDENPVEVSRAMANIVKRINEGPRTPLKVPLWHGFTHGTDFERLAGITTSTDGVRMPKPLHISMNFIRSFVLKDETFNVTRLNYADFMALWKADLTRLQSSGTKLLSWHGVNDPLIPYQSTVQYRKRVEMLMGGANEVDNFYRLFLAPGVAHCARGNGPVPTDPLAALVEWVEDGIPPETLEAETTTYEGDRVTRQLCAWPGKARYMGAGDAKRASSWSCHGGTERSVENEDHAAPEEDYESDRAAQLLGGLKDRIEGLGMGLTIG